MLFPQRLWAGVADGSVTVAFRRWKRPSVRSGGTLHSPAGLLAIEEVALIGDDEITDDDARAAGCGDREEVLSGLRPEGDLYRIRFRRAGDDPRIALRASTDLADAELAQVLAALARLDWAAPTLRLIAAHPARVSTELAAELGVERPLFKRRVRRLKALGLTESLEVGYRLSPRGAVVLGRLDGGPP